MLRYCCTWPEAIRSRLKLKLKLHTPPKDRVLVRHSTLYPHECGLVHTWYVFHIQRYRMPPTAKIVNVHLLPAFGSSVVEHAVSRNNFGLENAAVLPYCASHSSPRPPCVSICRKRLTSDFVFVGRSVESLQSLSRQKKLFDSVENTLLFFKRIHLRG